MGNVVSQQAEGGKLAELKQRLGCDYPGYDYHPSDRKNWMASLGPGRLAINEIIWPGTHYSATNGIGFCITRPFAECQTLSIYEQLVKGVRLQDVRVQENGWVYHGPVNGYHVTVVVQDVKRFLSETVSEIIILEIRTEFGHNDPPEFDKYLVENTLTPQGGNLGLYLPDLSACINRYARFFIAQCFKKGIADRLQVFSTDFVDYDFVDACVGLTYARVEGKI